MLFYWLKIDDILPAYVNIVIFCWFLIDIDEG